MGVGVEPDLDARQLVDQGTSVHDSTVGMAESELARLQLDLGLKEPYTARKRHGCVEVLIARDAVASAAVTEEGAVVGTQVGDTVICLIAEQGGVVAGRSWLERGCGLGCCGC